MFVGMLPKNANEAVLEAMFEQFGELYEIHMIKGHDGQSKGCAFIKFANRDCARSAIDMLNDTIPEVNFLEVVPCM